MLRTYKMITEKEFINKYAIPNLQGLDSLIIKEYKSRKNGELVLTAYITQHPELIAVFNTDLISRDRYNAILNVINQGRPELLSLGFKELFCYAEREFADLLIKHFQFKEIKEIPLIMEL